MSWRDPQGIPEAFEGPMQRIHSVIDRIEICAAALKSKRATAAFEVSIADMLMELHNELDVAGEEIANQVRT